MITLTNLALLKLYTRGIDASAKHHAPGVVQIIPALIGAVVLRAQKIDVHEASTRPASLGLAMHFYTRKGQYALSYDHGSNAVVLKRGSFRGPVLHSFNNHTPLPAITAAFANL